MNVTTRPAELAQKWSIFGRTESLISTDSEGGNFEETTENETEVEIKTEDEEEAEETEEKKIKMADTSTQGQKIVW